MILCKLYTLLFVALTGISFGQVALYEDFNYTVPGFVGGNTNTTDATGSNNWSTHSNSQIGTIDVISGNLTYPGLANSNGNKILLPGNNEHSFVNISKILTIDIGLSFDIKFVFDREYLQLLHPSK